MEDPLCTPEGESHLRFLGKNQDMPFFMVQAGKGYFNCNASGGRIKRPIRIPLAEAKEKSTTRAFLVTHAAGNNGLSNSADLRAEAAGMKSHTLCYVIMVDRCADNSTATQPSRQAKSNPLIVLKPLTLCLTVFLSTASFLGKRDPKTKRATFSDVKIDVYFNGELCNSAYVPERHRSEAFTMSELIVRFSGRRIGRHVERPWIMVPPGQNPDGTVREGKRSNGACPSVRGRWVALSRALNLEAEKSGGDENGALTVGGEYLASLAKLEMPAAVGAMQEEGGHSFGVIDVVVIYGRGQKDDASCPYLTEPTPIRVMSHGAEVESLLKSRRAVDVPKISKDRRNSQADAQTIDQTFSNTPSSRVRAKPGIDPQTTTGSGGVPNSRSSTPCRTHTKPSAVPTPSRCGVSPANPRIASELSTYISAKDSRTNRTVNTSIIHSQPSQDPYREAGNPSRLAPDQRHTNTNAVAPLRLQRSTLQTELVALAFDTSRTSKFGEATLPSRLRKPISTTMPSISTPNPSNTQNRTIPRPSIQPGRIRISQNARARARNPSGSFIKHQASNSTSSDNPSNSVPHNRSPPNLAKPVPPKRYKGPKSSPPPKPKEPKSKEQRSKEQKLEEPPPKRARMPYEMVLTDRRTAAEEIEAIEEQVKEEFEMAAKEGGYRRRRTTRAMLGSVGGSAGGSLGGEGMGASQPVEDGITQISDTISPAGATAGISPSKVRLKVNAPAPPESIRTGTAQPECSRTPSTPPIPNAATVSASAPSKPTPHPAKPSPSINLSATLINPSRATEPQERRHRYPSTSELPDFETPELSKDSVLTYAPPGILRQVRGERGGWFVEEGVVMGVRFVVGWGGGSRGG